MDGSCSTNGLFLPAGCAALTGVVLYEDAGNGYVSDGSPIPWFGLQVKEMVMA